MDLNQRAKLVEQTAFLDDLKPHYDDALNYCRALCASWSPSEAEEVLQEALLKALTHYATLQERSKFRSWLFQIITRTFYSAVRRASWKRLVPLQQAAEVAQMPAVYERPERQDESWLLYQALSTLPPKQRAALLLFELGGFSIEEIVTIQHAKSRSAVKSRLSRARRKLKRVLLQAEQGQLPQPAAGCHLLSGDLDHETLQLVAEAQKVL